MRNYKKIAAWKIACLHWLIAGFLLPMVLGDFLLSLLWRVLGMDLGTTVVLALIIKPLLLSLGAVISAVYINKKFVFVDQAVIAKLATYLFIIVFGGARVYSIIYGLFSELFVAMNWLIFIDNLVFLVSALSFYWTSKVFIKSPLSNQTKKEKT